jgi:hypothetical protein
MLKGCQLRQRCGSVAADVCPIAGLRFPKAESYGLEFRLMIFEKGMTIAAHKVGDSIKPGVERSATLGDHAETIFPVRETGGRAPPAAVARFTGLDFAALTTPR